MSVEVYLGIGGNLGDRLGNLRAAVSALGEVLRDVSVSGLYETGAWGDEDQPDFLNAVVRGWTELSALALLDRTQGIERELGRVRGGRRWGPRPIDIDILWYGSERIEHPRLTVPHPLMGERAFVLRPLADLAPSRSAPPDGTAVAERLTLLGESGVRRVAGAEWVG